tara:strand:+ start:406 stop:1098 length:693 start_codon:yes stop_codon:yes gene_type:complete
MRGATRAAVKAAKAAEAAREEDEEREEEDEEGEARCYFATFTDGETLILDINYNTDYRGQDVVSFNVRSGNISFEIIKPDDDATSASAGDELGHHAWEEVTGVRRSVARYIVAFAAIVRREYPQLEEVWYNNTAVIDDMDATDAGEDEDELREVVEDSLYRVRYYERLGFEFDVPYAEQVEGLLEDLKDERMLEEIEDAGFSGELLSIADTIAQTFPNECTLARLRMDVC